MYLSAQQDGLCARTGTSPFAWYAEQEVSPHGHQWVPCSLTLPRVLENDGTTLYDRPDVCLPASVGPEGAATQMWRRGRPMNVYLLRHAEAGAAPRDEERELTEYGRAQAATVAGGIRWLNLG